MTTLTPVCVQVYVHNVVSVGHKAYVLRPFLSLTLVFSSAFYALYRLTLNVSHSTDVAAGFTIGAVLAIYLVSARNSLVLLSYSGDNIKRQ